MYSRPVVVNQHQTNQGLGFVGALTILFVALKLMGYITWSWLWVLSPLWISFVIYAVFFIIAGLFILGVAIHHFRKERKYRKTFTKRFR